MILAALAMLTATPATLPAILTASKGGDVVVLEAGVYGNPGLRRRAFSPPLTIDARRATLERWVVSDVIGLTVRGGAWSPGCSVFPCYNYGLVFQRGANLRVESATFTGSEKTAPGELYVQADGYGVGFLGSSDVALSGNLFQSLRVGASLAKITGFQIIGNRFTRMRSDGLDVAQGWKGLIEGNVCDGTRLLTTEHADCFQLWSRPDAPPTSDIVIRRNVAASDAQGIGMFNHVRNGVDDGGFDRILIEENDIRSPFANGIGLVNARASVVRNNQVRTMPGAKYVSRIHTVGDVLRCGNVSTTIEPPC